MELPMRWWLDRVVSGEDYDMVRTWRSSSPVRAGDAHKVHDLRKTGLSLRSPIVDAGNFFSNGLKTRTGTFRRSFLNVKPHCSVACFRTF